MPNDLVAANIQARATIAAALIGSKAVDVTNVHWDGAQPANDPMLRQLKTAVDKVMIAIGLANG